ncbi:MAG: HlyD family efflux transporter periplasmic adaptor subunit, partial [Pedobacter sp.]
MFSAEEEVEDEDKEIGIITYYMPQMQRIRKAMYPTFSKNEWRNFEQNKFENEFQIPFRINTVDRFQGMERNIIIIIVLVVLVVSVFSVRSLIQPSITRAEFTSAVVSTGNIENTINASGEVLPEFEEVLTSPINAAVREVLMDAGMKIKAGQSILTLDKSAAQTEYDKLGFLIESKENEISKLKLDLEKSFYDIKSNNSIKQLRISNFKDAVSSAQRLFKAGGGTKEDIDQAELNLKVAELEKQQLENEIRSKQQTMKIEIREAELSLAIQRNDQAALTRKLKLADIIATRDGVITWVNKNIGASVKEGESLARIANLSGYKVAGSISDTQLEDLRNNMPAIIRINDTQLRGSINNISPAVNNS